MQYPANQIVVKYLPIQLRSGTEVKWLFTNCFSSNFAMGEVIVRWMNGVLSNDNFNHT